MYAILEHLDRIERKIDAAETPVYRSGRGGVNLTRLKCADPSDSMFDPADERCYSRERYELRGIVTFKGRGRSKEYLVEWQGDRASDQYTWELASHLRGEKIVKEYDDRRRDEMRAYNKDADSYLRQTRSLIDGVAAPIISRTRLQIKQLTIEFTLAKTDDGTAIMVVKDNCSPIGDAECANDDASVPIDRFYIFGLTRAMMHHDVVLLYDPRLGDKNLRDLSVESMLLLARP